MVKKSQGLVINQPEPIRKQVYTYLREQILNHTVDSGNRLVESQIAKEIGSSRTPVREALHLLEKDGFIEAIPRVGYRVKKLRWEELDEIFEIRRINESLACKWAIRNIDVKNLRALEKNIKDTEQIVKQGTHQLFLNYDEEFHGILVQASGSKHLYELCQHLRRLMLRYRTESIVRSKPTIEKALDGHLQIFENLRAKNEKGIEKALEDHLHWSREDIRIKALSRSEKS